jgi:cbb3-type cytochrome oxidase subunit 3
MVWLVLESMLAGAILVGIVWWTMRPARRRDREEAARAEKRAERVTDGQ